MDLKNQDILYVLGLEKEIAALRQAFEMAIREIHEPFARRATIKELPAGEFRDRLLSEWER